MNIWSNMTIWTEDRFVVSLRPFQLPGGMLSERVYATITITETKGHEYMHGNIPIGVMLPGSTSSESTFTTMTGWLTECLEEHEGCVPTPIPLHRNVRFLEIKDDVILLQQDIHPERYACLSHCWGSGEAIVKTSKG